MSRQKKIEDGQWDEYRNAVRWVVTGSVICSIVFFVLMSILIGFASVIEAGFSKSSVIYYWDYLVYSFQRPWHVFIMIWRWLVIFFQEFPAIWYLWLPLLPFYWAYKGVKYVLKKNPYRFMNTFYGASAIAKQVDMIKMGLNGKYLLLGESDGMLLQLNDTRSAFCVGAGNEGKTESIVIPAILSAQDMCMVINESGNLFDTTSGYRATQGPVFKIDFSELDNSEKGIFYPSWNPLARGNLPLYGPGRYNYISALCFMLIKDGPTGADPYWTKAGRSALEGFVNYLCDKCDAAKANDYFVHRLAEGELDEEDRKVLASYYKAMPDKNPAVIKARQDLEENKITQANYLPIGKWDPIPVEWHGHQANLSILIDMVTLIQMEINDELKEKRDSGDPSYYTADPWSLIIENMLEESTNLGYSRRVVLELNQIQNLPGKQRSSVLSTGFAGIAPFKNSAIRERTSMNDFTYKDLRGMKNPETGEYQPITFYLSSNDEYGLSSVFLNINTGYLMSFPPNVGGHGPYPMLFVLDNFYRMDKMPKFIDMVGMGRSQKVSFLIVVQDPSQVSAKYSETDLDVLLTNCSVKIIKRTNNPEVSGKFIGMIGKRTFKFAGSMSYSQNFFGKTAKTYNVSYKFRSDGLPGFSKGGMTGALGKGDSMIMVQGFKNRPIKGKALYCRKTDFLVSKMAISKAKFISKELVAERDIEDINPPLYVLFETSADRKKRQQQKQQIKFKTQP